MKKKTIIVILSTMLGVLIFTSFTLKSSTKKNDYGKNLYENTTKEDSIKTVVKNFIEGFTKEDFNRVRSSLGNSFIMLNGNFSCNPEEWEGHQHLDQKEIDEWIKWMLKKVTPISNTYEIKSVDIRNNSAIITTLETGSNQFRNWKNEQVAYLIGKVNGEWRIVGFFIKNIKNPN
ncbi:MAG: hypothetical protein AAFX55_04225 [Bacteroidota bacterium]